MKPKFSLFLLEKYYGGWGSELVERCFEHVGTFDTLEQALLEQKERELKTIIIPSYGV